MTMKCSDSMFKAFCCAVFLSSRLFAQPLLTEADKTYEYKGETFRLGLYEGTNEMPEEHLADGLKIAEEMRKMSKINIVPIGHSVPTNIFNGWNWGNAKTQFNLAENTSFASACAGAVMAWDWLSRIKNGGALAGIAASDVHVLVVQLTWAPFFGPDNYEKNTPLSEKIDSMSHDFRRLVLNAKKNYPNLKMILFEADPWQNDHEPYHAYHEWFFARGVVLDQIKGDDPQLSSYMGEGAEAVWIDLGGYFWYTNAPRSYYSDCCHITGSGAAHYQQKWIEALIDYNPVVSQWLLKDPPEPPVRVRRAVTTSSMARDLRCMAGKSGMTVSFSLAAAAKVGLGLFSIDGRVIVPVSERACGAGLNSIALDAGIPLAPGAYIIHLSDPDGSRAQRPVTVAK